MQMFENKYKEWLNNVYTPIRRGVYAEGLTNIPGFDLTSKTPNVIQGARGSDTTAGRLHSRERSSKQGSKFSSRSVKYAMAQLKVKRLLAEQEIKEGEIAFRLPEEYTFVRRR